MDREELIAALEAEPHEMIVVMAGGRSFEIERVTVQYFDDENGNSGCALVLDCE